MISENKPYRPATMPFREGKVNGFRSHTLSQIENKALGIEGVYALGPYEVISNEEVPGKLNRRGEQTMAIYKPTRIVLLAPKIPAKDKSELRKKIDPRISSEIYSRDNPTVSFEVFSPEGDLLYIHREYHETFVGVEAVIRDGKLTRLFSKQRLVVDIFPSLEAAQAELERRQQKARQ